MAGENSEVPSKVLTHLAVPTRSHLQCRCIWRFRCTASGPCWGNNCFNLQSRP